jgi:carbamoyl-phosphate synthase large subunit
VAPLNILVTGACGVTPRAIARSLRASSVLSGARLVGADRGGNWYGFYEGLYDRVYRVSEPADAGYAELVAEICRQEEIDVALVAPEAEVLFWSWHAFPAPTLLPPRGLVEIAISKGKLYDALRETGLVPRYRIASRDELLERRGLDLDGGAVWLRDYSDASSSGIGSIQLTEPEEAYAWAYLNPEIPSYMVAEHLPGRNVACSLLFHEDDLLMAGCYERLEYFMGHLAVSGVTGNINRGRLVNDERARRLAEQAVRLVGGLAGEPAHGLLTVDFREDRTGALKVTEINVRHVAATSALAAGGANLAEAQILATLGRFDEIGDPVPHFPEDNIILRDIDGAPIWLTGYRELAVGEFAQGAVPGTPAAE